MTKITIEIREHEGYKEWKALNENRNGKPMIGLYFGHHQFIYSRNGNSISLVEMKDINEVWYWEIMCIKGDKLFEDVKRFPSKQEAENYIMRLLTPEEQL